MKIITTGDQSHTIYSEEFQDTYHSTHGAIRESKHVYIQQGFDYRIADCKEKTDNVTLRILEVGFGTGLNVLLTLLETDRQKVSVNYTTLESSPLSLETIHGLNYADLLGCDCYQSYQTLHLCAWNEPHPIKNHFTFTKTRCSVLEYTAPDETFDIIYFDAFSPTTQPELWTDKMMRKMFAFTAPKGILVSYCSKVSFQKSLQSAGFRIEKIPGPPGKREMIRAHKV
ncbi:MAG: tRNA (5-methylaminomethyl-2-thiouridine)(34)-methyltransferase MnmD [Bacteroidetes bacterium]|nr:tRNA (5-methylaminomethyl-2-thiouridine)(34)-methyltransferase MnmD [Bacteroidota bacterium]